MNDEMLALAEKSAETDLAFLLKAKEEAKKRMKDNPSPENISAFSKARDGVDAETTRLSSASGGRVYKTQLDAVSYLKDAGYKVSKSQFNRDVKARKMPTNADGHFEESALLGYAAACLTPTGQAANSALSSATTEKLTAAAEKDKWQAARQKLKYEKEQGLLMPRSEHERDLAARALFFKREVEGFMHLHGGAIIHLTGGDEAKLPDLIHYWEKETADWLNTWSAEREFIIEAEDESDSVTEDT